jgi:polysaccharide deacetylase 2 family uncharacterized protein YibQ
MASRRASRPLLSLVALCLFAGGIYLGTRLAEPPPRPRFPPEEEVIHDAHLDHPAQGGGQRIATSSAPPVSSLTDPPPAPAGTPAAPRQPPPASGGQPRIAIVIDDLGRGVGSVDALLALGEPLTFAVLPFESETPKVVARLREAGAEILLHLPMEARGKNDPGPGALRLAMSRAELQAETRAALAAVPGAAGVNNHMGSALAADAPAMEAVLAVLKEEGLYFLDSRTAADTQGYSVARRLGLPAGERQVFLDNERDTAAIAAQLQSLFELARSRGGAIAIAHPYAETLSALRSELPKAKAAGIAVVPASQLLDRRPPAD